MNERTSSYSQGASNCAEVGQVPGRIVVGDTKDPDSPRLVFSVIDWDKFLARVRRDG